MPALSSSLFPAGESPLVIDRVLVPAGYTLHEGLLPSLIVALLGGGLFGVNVGVLLSYGITSWATFMIARADRGFTAGCLDRRRLLWTGSPNTSPTAARIRSFRFSGWSLCLLALVRSPPASLERPGTWCLELSFAAACLSSWYFGVFVAVLTAMFCLFFVFERESRRTVFTVSAVLVATGLLLLPLSPVVLLGTAGLETGGAAAVVDGSADLLSFVLPPPFHWLWGTHIYALQQDWPGDPSLRSNALGWLATALAIAGLVGTAYSRRVRAFLGTTGLLFGVLALGPFLAVAGLGGWTVDRPIEDVEALRLPYYWLQDVFPFSATRATSRFAIVTSLMVALLAAAGVDALRRRLRPGKWRSAATAGVLAVMLAEIWPVWPLPLDQPVPVSPFYSEISRETETFSIVELPFRINAYRILYAAGHHNNGVIGGAVDKPFSRFRRLISGYPLLRQLSLIGTPQQHDARFLDVFQHGAEDYFDDVMAGFRIRYFVVHKWDENILSYGNYPVEEPLSQPVRSWLATRAEPVFEDDQVAVFRPGLVSEQWLFPVIGPRWGGVESHEGYVDRVLSGNRGTLEIHSSEPVTVDVTLGIAVILVSERDLSIALNGLPVFSGVLPRREHAGEFESVLLSGLRLRAGVNVFELTSLEPARTIAEVHGGDDERPISFLLNDFRITSVENN